MKTIITGFKCDNCEEKIEIKEGESFPYKSKWVYLYNLQVKIPNVKEYRDKHFCCRKCLCTWLMINIG